MTQKKVKAKKPVRKKLKSTKSSSQKKVKVTKSGVIKNARKPQTISAEMEKDLGFQEPNKDQLKRICDLTEEAAAIDARLERFQIVADDLKRDYNIIVQNKLPDIMSEVGLNTFQLVNGTSVTIKNFISGSLPKDPVKNRKALASLRKLGGENLIKNQLIVEFDKGQSKMSRDTIKMLKKLGIDVVAKKTIHHKTLCAFISEIRQDNPDIPYDTLGLYAGKRAKITLSGENI